MIGAQLPILSPEEDEKLLRDAGFHGIGLFYVGLPSWLGRVRMKICPSTQ